MPRVGPPGRPGLSLHRVLGADPDVFIQEGRSTGASSCPGTAGNAGQLRCSATIGMGLSGLLPQAASIISSNAASVFIKGVEAQSREWKVEEVRLRREKFLAIGRTIQ